MKTYLIGGATRDMLLGKNPNDKDYVVIDSNTEEMLFLGFTEVGKDFPVFLHPVTKEEYALARIERSTGNAYKDFTFDTNGVTLKDDVLRRDLTINTICQDVDTGEIIDYFNGQRDLKDGILRHVSEAFKEDPVRILRVARFAAKFGFKVAPETKALIKEMIKAGMLNDLVAERVFKELEKALGTQNPELFFITLDELGALEILFPEIANLKGKTQTAKYHPETIADLGVFDYEYTFKDHDAFIHTMLVLKEAVQKTDDIVIRFLSLVHDLGKGQTMIEDLPKHHGHEAAGVELVEQFCDRIKTPADWKDLGKKCSKEHLSIHKFNELNDKTVLKLFSRTDAFRNPEGFKKVLIASICDANGRGGKEKQSFDKVDSIMDLLFKTKKTDVTELVKQGFKGQQMADEVYRARLVTIKKHRVNV